MSINVSVAGNTVRANVTTGIGPQGPPGPVGPQGPVLVASVNEQTGTVVLTSVSVSAASAVHGHVISDVTGLQASLDSKASAASTNLTRVTTLNGLNGAITIAAGSNITVATQGATITIDAAADAVSSVNGSKGAVVLTSQSVSAASAVHTHVSSSITDFAAAVTSANIVRSLNGITGAVAISHTSVSAAAASHTHDAAEVASGTLDLARIPTHTHAIAQVDGLQASLDGKADAASTNVVRVQSLAGLTGVVSLTAGANVTISTAGSAITIAAGVGDSLPSQATNGGRLLGTDGTAASWVTRYSVVDPVVVAGDGIVATRDTAVGSITLAVAGGTTGLTVGSATPQDLGVAAAGTSGNASREDHVHKLPTIVDITAAAAVHTHVVSDVTGFAAEAAKHGPVSSVNSLTGTVTLTSLSVSAASAVHTHTTTDITGFNAAAAAAAPVASVNGVTGTIVLTHTSVSAAAASHSHAASDVTSGTFDIARIPTIGYTALSGVPTTFAPASHTHDASAIAAGTVDAARLPANVASLNGLTGTLTIAAGSNVTVSTAGSSITITAASGGGGGGGGETVSRSIIWLLR